MDARRSLSRLFVATTIAVTAGRSLAACGSAESAPTTEVDAGLDAADSSARPRPNPPDSTPEEPVLDSGSPKPSQGPCGDVVASGPIPTRDIIEADAFPPPQGGVLVDGTYDLIAVHAVKGVSFDAVVRRVSRKFTGGKEEYRATPVDAGFYEYAQSANITTADIEMTREVTCTNIGQPETFSVPYTATSSTLTVFDYGSYSEWVRR